MPRSFEGDFHAEGLRFGIIASRYHDEIVSGLLRGAIECLTRHGAPDDAIIFYRVPGAFEIPMLARALANQFDALVTIGCLIRGETAHFEYVAGETAAGITRAALDTGVPVIFGVLTVDNREQALDRLGGNEGHKGEEAALTAIEMVSLLRGLP